MREKRKIYYEKNKDKTKEQKRLYQIKNKEKIKEQKRLYFQKTKIKKTLYKVLTYFLAKSFTS